MAPTRLLLLIPALAGCGHGPAATDARPAVPAAPRACFLLHEIGVGRVRRAPSEGCDERVPPMSTFKIAHALAGLDAGVLAGPDEVIRYDGSASDFESARRDHTLATAMRHSVLWYFQRIAERLGPTREADYLKKLDYGNADSSSHLTSFWLYESLLVSPEEQERFLVRLYEDTLPVSHEAQETVRRTLIQPPGTAVNAAGSHPFAQPWPEGTVVSAKTGSGSRPGSPDVRWLVGNVIKGRRSWIFVSNVVGEDLPPLAAIDLAARSLKEAGIL